MMNKKYDDIYWMHHALSLAKKAAEQNEVPVGAIVVFENEIVGEGWNRPINQCDPTAHAEIIALREAAKNLGNYRLKQTSLYVTLEPCLMCVGAMVHARIENLIFGASDPKSGAVQSVLHALDEKHLNHRVKYQGDVLADLCGNLLSDFFRERR